MKDHEGCPSAATMTATPAATTAASGLQTRFPENWSRSRLKREAVDHTASLSDDGYVPADTDRLVVNMLRHEYTNYDDHQTAARHREARQVIAVRFPWLADECDRQIRRRVAEDSEWEIARQVAQEADAARARWRSERAAQSRSEIGRFEVGMLVAFQVRGHDRTGRVVKVGRSRVTVKYRIKSGAERTALLYARDVWLAAETALPRGRL